MSEQHPKPLSTPLRAMSAMLVIMGLLGGCGGSKLEGLSDTQLQDKAYACTREHNLSPGAAIACDNYRKECQRRRELGSFVC
jgi:hypothetical protein